MLKALAAAIASTTYVVVIKLMKARMMMSRVPRMRPDSLKALGRARAPTPMMRLKMYAKPNWGNGRKWH